MIEVEGLHKSYGAVAAVDGVSFVAPDGQITGLLGANGAGKTTTLGMICGVAKPDAGTIRIDGAAAATIEMRRRLGALPDHQGIYSRLTARENIRFFGQLHGLSGARLEDRVQAAVSLLGLVAIADRRTAGFSQGERMKVALARALVHDPPNLLLDEPTNGLDIPTVRTLRRLLEDLRARGTCIVFSSHVMEEVSALCDTVVILAGGRVVAAGHPHEICRGTECASLDDAFMRLSNAEEVPVWLPRT
jgi:sodium transport system ATP-binding protein